MNLEPFSVNFVHLLCNGQLSVSCDCEKKGSVDGKCWTNIVFKPARPTSFHK